MTKDDLLTIIGARDAKITELERTVNNALNSIKAFIILADTEENVLVIDPSEFPDINEYNLQIFRTPQGFIAHRLIPPEGEEKPVSKLILPS